MAPPRYTKRATTATPSAASQEKPKPSPVSPTSTTTATTSPEDSTKSRKTTPSPRNINSIPTATAPAARTSTAPSPPLTRDEDDFAIELPIIRARIYDPGELEDQLDRTQLAIVRLDLSIQDVENDPTVAGRFSAVATDTTALNTSLQGMDNQPLEAELGVGIAIGIPSKKFAFGLHLNGGAVVQFVTHYADANVLNTLAADAQAIENCRDAGVDCAASPPNLTLITVDNAENPTTANVLFDTNNDFNSTADLRGLAFSEVGIAVARDFGAYTVGVTPKYVKIKTFDYQAAVDDADSSDTNNEDFIKSAGAFNFDIGVAQARERWRFGAVIKDVIPKEFDTAQKELLTPEAYSARGGAITMKPRARVGASYDIDWAVVAADFDVTQNDSVGSDGTSQLLALGAELDAWRFFQLRRVIALICKTTSAALRLAVSVCRYSACTWTRLSPPTIMRLVPLHSLVFGFSANDTTLKNSAIV